MYWVIFCISCQSTVVHCSMSFIQCSLKLFKQRKFFYFLWECLPQTEDLAVKGCFQMFNLHYAHFPTISAEVPFLMFIQLKRTLPSWSLRYCLFGIQTKGKSLGMSRKCWGRMVLLEQQWACICTCIFCYSVFSRGRFQQCELAEELCVTILLPNQVFKVPQPGIVL